MTTPTRTPRRKSRSPKRAVRPNPKNKTSLRPSPPGLIVGLTGPNASGKGEVAKYLQAHGFDVFSLSDVVREEATHRGLDHTRDNLIRVGVALREAGGAGALAHRILPRLGRRAVVDSVRNPGEVGALRRRRDFVLLGIDAPLPLRFERSQRRGRAGDGATLDEFAAKEHRENSATPAGQQLVATLALADAVVINDATIDDLHRRVRKVLRQLGKPLAAQNRL